MSPLIYTVDANAFELFSRADGRLRALDRMLAPEEVVLADKVHFILIGAAPWYTRTFLHAPFVAAGVILCWPSCNYRSRYFWGTAILRHGLPRHPGAAIALFFFQGRGEVRIAVFVRSTSRCQ